MCDELKLGKRLDPTKVTSRQLKDSVIEVLTNRAYHERMIEFCKACSKHNGIETASQLIVDYLNQADKKID